MAKKRPPPPKRKPPDANQVSHEPTEIRNGKRVVRGSWGALKLRFSDRHKDFDESRDS